MSFGPGLFEPPGGEWKRLSPRYIPVKRIGSLIGNTVLFGGMAALAWALLREMWVVFAVLAAGASVLAWRLWRDGRWVRSWGYAQRDGDLCITHGSCGRIHDHPLRAHADGQGVLRPHRAGVRWRPSS